MTDLDELEAAMKAATQGPWGADTIDSEGEYGSGPNTTVGFKVSAIYSAGGQAIFDALNSDAICVREDYPDEDGYVAAWDEVSDANARLICLAKNSLPALIAAARERDAMRGAVVDDPDWIASGVSDAAVEAGIEAWDKAKHDMENYVPGVTTDWDEGMIVAAIFKAVARTTLEETRHD